MAGGSRAGHREDHRCAGVGGASLGVWRGQALGCAEVAAEPNDSAVARFAATMTTERRTARQAVRRSFISWTLAGPAEEHLDVWHAGHQSRPHNAVNAASFPRRSVIRVLRPTPVSGSSLLVMAALPRRKCSEASSASESLPSKRP